MACTAWSIVTVSIVIAVFLGLAIQDTAAQQAELDALFSELLTFVEIVGQFDPGTRFQMRGADAPSVPLLTGVEINVGWEEVGVGSASGGDISDNSGDSYVPSVAIAPDGASYAAAQRENEFIGIYLAAGNALRVLRFCSDGSSGRLAFEKQPGRRSAASSATEWTPSPWSRSRAAWRRCLALSNPPSNTTW